MSVFAMGSLGDSARRSDAPLPPPTAAPDVAARLCEAFENIRLRHVRGASGAAVCRARAEAVDAAVGRLADNFISNVRGAERNSECPFCIVALGGYGRGELAPKSDVDIMFLYADSCGEDFKKRVADAVMYPLWDAHLTLGHSSRTVAEAEREAASDVLTRNAMLDARLVWGSPKLYKRFQKAVSSLCRRMGKKYFDELLRLKYERHSRYGWSPCLQEPNLKNGVGGLRDIQTLAWKIRLKFGSPELGALVRRRKLSLADYKMFMRAADFIKRVRNEIHYAANRTTDVLDLELQPIIARNLGFRGSSGAEGVEEFMRRLYFSFRIVDTAAKTLRKSMGIELPDDVVASMRHKLSVRQSRRKIYKDGFIIQNGVINAQRSSVFRSDPARLIKLFSYIQHYRAAPSDSLELLVRDCVALIDDSVRSNPEAVDAFLSIFNCRGNVAPVLEMMHFWGVLGAFVPEFGDITCFVQHEFYHRYTADVHTLNTIAVADKIFRSKEGEEPYWGYHAALMSVRFPAHLLYLILFLHDIGKGDGIKGHAQLGAELGERILRRLGVRESDIEPILFVVRNHLEMARFWQSHDVEDAKAVEKFLSLIPSEEHLKFLYVATFCDAMGTSESFWNSYKQALHSMLYSASLRKIRSNGLSLDGVLEERRRKLERELLDSGDLPESKEFAMERIRALPLSYFAFHGVSDLAMHVGMAGRLIRRLRSSEGGGKIPPVIKWIEDPGRSVVRLYAVSADARGLFSLMAGVITIYGMKILSSKAFTCSDGITIDTFYLTGVAGVSRNKQLRTRFSNEVVGYYGDFSGLSAKIDEIFYSSSARKNSPADIFMHRENNRTVLEISVPDRDGLLYKISSAINKCRYSITFARINTEAGWAFDTFHVVPMKSAASHSELLEGIRSIFLSAK